ncbi:MAG: type II secretion system F family protein [Puniceicoccales bacterium]|jgi:type IV pilus assembly protein PilC|nr:type II secretion system F family protein [Puniceicoccales bacterium]
MKIRQFLRNSFQNAVDKYQENFFKGDKLEADPTPEELGDEDVLENDFRALTRLSKTIEQQQTADNAEQQMVIGSPSSVVSQPNYFPSGNDFDTGPVDAAPILSASSLGTIAGNRNITSPSVSGLTGISGSGPSSVASVASVTSVASPFADVQLSASSGSIGVSGLAEVTASQVAPIASAGGSSETVNANLGSDFAVVYGQKPEVVSVAKKIGKQHKKSYSFTPKKSKINEKAAEKSAKKKKQTGSLKLKIEKKAQVVRQLAILLDSGMDLRSSLAILEEQESRNRNIWFFIHDLFVKIEAGDSFSDALLSSAVRFDESEIAMVRAGEAVGKLSDTLSKMAALMEKKVRVKKKITSAMFYPATVLVVSSVVVLLLTTFVVPKFEKVILEQIGEKGMPKLTALIVQSSRFVSSHLLEVFLIIGGFIILFIAVKTITSIKKIAYKILLKIPLIGDCITKWSVVLFSRTFGDLMLCGCSVVESLKMARASVGNYDMKANLSLTIEDVQQGLSLTESLRRRSVLPVMAEGLIKVGEESGKLGEMMNKVSVSYEEQLDEVITRMTSLIEPILVVFLAGFVGSVVIGLFMPLVSLVQNISA